MEDEQKAKEKPKPRRKLVPVQVVGRKGPSVLVQWQEKGMFRRGFVPAGKVEGEKVDAGELKKAVPYGLEWEKWIEITATPESVANELRRQGVWRWEDMAKPALVAANSAFDLGEFLRRVSQEVQK